MHSDTKPGDLIRVVTFGGDSYIFVTHLDSRNTYLSRLNDGEIVMIIDILDGKPGQQVVKFLHNNAIYLGMSKDFITLPRKS